MAWYTAASSGATCVAAYNAIGASSLANSYVNLANPGTFDAAPGTAPTWAAGTGWTFNGTTQYLTTGYTPSSTQANRSMIVRFSGAATSGRFEDTVTIPAITTSASKEAYRDRMFNLHADATHTIEVEIIEQGGVLFNDTFGLRDTVRVHSATFGYAATHTVVGYNLSLPSTGVASVGLTLNQHPRRMATDTRDWAEGPGGRGGGGLARLKAG